MKFLLIYITLISSLLANIGEVTALQGNATLLRNNNTLTLSQGFKLTNNDTINTAAHSKVQVILNDDTVITIGPNSEYYFQSINSKTQEASMQLKRGFFKTVTGKIGKIAPERFKIKTKAATIGIRGTQFMAYVTNDEEQIACIHGKIVVFTADKEYDIPSGSMIRYKDGVWSVSPIDMERFSPVLIGMTLQKRNDALANFDLPQIQDSYLLEEQIIEDRDSELIQNEQPFSFDLGVDSTTQPPSFNP